MTSTTSQLTTKLTINSNASKPIMKISPTSPKKDAADMVSPAMAKPFWSPPRRPPAA